MNWLPTKVLGFAGKKLDGYKTKIGGVGLILYGLIGAINIMFPGTIPGVELTIDATIGSLSGGFAIIGIGGKIDKNTAAVKESGNVLEDSAAAPQRVISPALSEDQRDALNAN
jgi:hypothetical protein